MIYHTAQINHIFSGKDQIILGYFDGDKVFEDLADGINEMPAAASDVSKWTGPGRTLYDKCFTNWKYDEASHTTRFNFNGVGGWELIGYEVTGLKKNTNYTWQFLLTKLENTVSSDTADNRSFVGLVLGKAPSSTPTDTYGLGSRNDSKITYPDIMNPYIDQSLILGAYVQKVTPQNPIEGEGRFTAITFNTGYLDSVYLAFDFGQVYDNVTFNVEIAQEMLSEGSSIKKYSYIK